MLTEIDWYRALVIFFILHVLVYPSSNGYNCLQDQDTGSIGGLEHPPQPDLELNGLTRTMDTLAIVYSMIFLGVKYAIILVCYIFFSRLYSYRKIRLKKYPIIGYLTVVLNQGGLIFVLVSLVSSNIQFNEISPMLIIAAILLIGGFYPITQIYQHEQDKADGVTTISMLLGKRGTFVFCGLLYAFAFSLLAFHFLSIQQIELFFILQVFFIPVILFFLFWAIQVWKDERNADFKRTMRMNWIASIASNGGFITLLILKHNG
jgi:1,4-dihydroxy-2-naphthoate octaprenyltransferase